MLDRFGAEYTAANIANLTFQGWLEQGTGLTTIVPTLLGDDGFPNADPGDGDEPGGESDEVAQLNDNGSAASMLAYRGSIKFEMEYFTAWGIDNILHVLVRDEGEGLKDYYENYVSWVIDDIAPGATAFGMEPLMAGTGLPMSLTVTSSIDGTMPMETKLEQNYPNPFNPTTTINFSLKSEGIAKLNVYNYTGQLVNSLVNGQMNAGHHTVNFDASNLSAGVYYYTLEANNMTMTNKMVLVK